MALQIVLATKNPDKVKELQAIFDKRLEELKDVYDIGQEIEIIPADYEGEADETGLSFVENAILKARYASLLTGKPAIADDSGLVVWGLGESKVEPGVFSARYTDHDLVSEDEKDLPVAERNINKVLRGVKEQNLNGMATFFCGMAFVKSHDDPVPITTLGEVDGTIIEERRGENGFGYDSIFLYENEEGESKTFAEMTGEEKSKVSHRSMAVECLVVYLASTYAVQ